MPVLLFHSFREELKLYKQNNSLRQCQTSQMPILFSDDAAQGHPFMEAIVSNTGLPLRRELLELTDDGAGDEIRSRRHLFDFCCPLRMIVLLFHKNIFSEVETRVQA
jgi:hypothetical protein